MTGSTADATREFKLARPTGAGYTVIASGASVLIPANQTYSANVRIPTQAGDVLGEYVPNASTTCNKSTGNSGDVVTIYGTGDIAVGGTATGGTAAPQYRISVAATVEPDVDGDGYGDTSQDHCAVESTTQGTCAIGAVRGRAKVGKRLAAPTVPGLPAGSTERFQWYRLTKVKSHGPARYVYRAIAGAHGSHYKLRSKDKGTKVLVRVTVTAPGGAPTAIASRPKRVH